MLIVLFAGIHYDLSSLSSVENGIVVINGYVEHEVVQAVAESCQLSLYMECACTDNVLKNYKMGWKDVL